MILFLVSHRRRLKVLSSSPLLPFAVGRRGGLRPEESGHRGLGRDFPQEGLELLLVALSTRNVHGATRPRRRQSAPAASRRRPRQSARQLMLLLLLLLELLRSPPPRLLVPGAQRHRVAADADPAGHGLPDRGPRGPRHYRSGASRCYSGYGGGYGDVVSSEMARGGRRRDA